MSWEQIPGWFGFRATYDKFIAAAQDGDVFLEVGVAFGRSIAYLSDGLRAKGVKARVIGIDPWIDDWPGEDAVARAEAGLPTWGAQYAPMARACGGPFSAFVTAMREHSPTSLEHVEIWRGYSHNFYRVVPPCRGIMIDGDHNYKSVLLDIVNLRLRVLPGGMLAGDDYSAEFPGVVKAVHEVFGALPHVGEYKTTFEVTL